MNRSQSSPQKTAILIICVVVLLPIAGGLLFWVEEDWKANRAWNKVSKAHAAKGNPLVFGIKPPQPTPDDQNFAATPLLKPLLQYKMVRGPNGWSNAVYDNPEAVEKVRAIKLPTGPEKTAKQSDGRIDLAVWERALRHASGYEFPKGTAKPHEAILFALRRWDAQLAELETASRRPYSHFAIHYDENQSALLAHLVVLKSIAQILQLRAMAYLEANDAAAALAEIEFIERLASALQDGQLLIEQLLRINIETKATEAAWEGIVDRRWDTHQLAKLQSMFAARNPRTDMAQALRNEEPSSLGFFNAVLKNRGLLRGLYQSGLEENQRMDSMIATLSLNSWIRQNQVTLVDYHDRLATPLESWSHDDLPFKDIHWDIIERPLHDRWIPYTWFAQSWTVSLKQAPVRAERLLAVSRMGQIACALERSRLDTGSYPSSINSLVPKYLEKAPLDPCGGQPFHYRASKEAEYTLYSVGPNGTDDDGTLTGFNWEGDWPWPQPVESEKRLF